MTDCHHDPSNSLCDMDKARINVKVKNVRCVDSYEQYMCKEVTVQVKQPDGTMATVVLKQKEATLTYSGGSKVFKNGNYPQPNTDAGGGFEVFKVCGSSQIIMTFVFNLTQLCLYGYLTSGVGEILQILVFLSLQNLSPNKLGIISNFKAGFRKSTETVCVSENGSIRTLTRDL